MSVNILFWNIKKNADTFGIVATALQQLEIAVCVLAEFPFDMEYDMRTFLPDDYDIQELPKTSRLIFIHHKKVKMQLAYEIQHSRGIVLSTSIDELATTFNIVGCHLVDSINHDESDRHSLAISFHNTLRIVESNLDNDKTIMIGDFNMNPFDQGMSSVYAFNAVMDPDIALKNKRTSQFEQYPYFFNPMWYFFGHPEHINGTIIHNGNGNWYHWNLYDQVLLRPSLISCFDYENLKILTKIGNTELLSPTKQIRSDISDHLPIYVSLNIQ